MAYYGILSAVLVKGTNLNSLVIYNGTIGQKKKQKEEQSRSNVPNVGDGIFVRNFSVAYNIIAALRSCCIKKTNAYPLNNSSNEYKS